MKLFFRKYGDGPPLVILHGLYGSSDNWVSVARKISNYYTVYLPDQRNHGRSLHSILHDYDAMSSDLFELVSDLNIGKFFLAGHSMGGKTAVRFAIRWPELLEGLLVADISPFETRTSNSTSYNQHLSILKILEETDISRATSRGELEKLLSERIKSPGIRALIMKNAERNDDGTFRWKINSVSLLKNLEIIVDSVVGQPGSFDPVTGFPVIFLKGENSDYLPEEDFPKILNLFPSAEFRIIRNAGHWLHVDNPEAVTEAFLSLPGK
jgi:esterase